MTDKKELTERRKHERLKVKNGAIATIRLSGDLSPAQKYCQIINISKGGLACRYIIRNSESNEPVNLDVLFIQDNICSAYLKYVSLKPVWASHEPTTTSSSHLKTEQLGVQFGKMTCQQESQLDRFIEKCTIR